MVAWGYARCDTTAKERERLTEKAVEKLWETGDFEVIEVSLCLCVCICGVAGWMYGYGHVDVMQGGRKRVLQEGYVPRSSCTMPCTYMQAHTHTPVICI
jgi:hypothetical protein